MYCDRHTLISDISVLVSQRRSRPVDPGRCKVLMFNYFQFSICFKCHKTNSKTGYFTLEVSHNVHTSTATHITEILKPYAQITFLKTLEAALERLSSQRLALERIVPDETRGIPQAFVEKAPRPLTRTPARGRCARPL